MKKQLFFLFTMMFIYTSSLFAQITNSSMTGKVTMETAKGESVIGASVVALHEPSGTRYRAVTNTDGRFVIQGMRTGGPYEVTVSYIGYQTKTLKGITLQLGETYHLAVWLTEDTNELGEVVVTAAASKFATEKTGATTNISNAQLAAIPTVNRSIEDVIKLSPYSGGGMIFAGSSGRSANFTVDGANLNQNFGLSDDLPGGGTPISLEAIDEMQVVVAPYDVRQTNFIGGGVNAITKSGTNTFKGTAYTYFRNQDMRGNRILHKDLGARADESKTTYGLTLGGPILKDRLFFFFNYEKEITPGEVVTYRAREDNEKAGGTVSRTKKSDMEAVSKYLRDNYGYDTGSWTNYPADLTNEKFLIRLDWNISDAHHLALRYNNTKNVKWMNPNGNSGDWVTSASRLNNTYRMGPQSMAFANSLYSLQNKVETFSADLNSRFGNHASNQLLITHTFNDDTRGSNSSLFPFIDIMYKDDDGNEQMEPYMSAGYELFSYNNGVKNKMITLNDNFTYFLGDHKITAGLRYEWQYAENSYMREGTGYYRFRSVDDFLAGAAPESVAFTYGFNNNTHPTASVTFNQFSLYAQDEWDITNKLKFNYGIRLDEMVFDNSDIERNTAIYDLDFGGQRIDTGKWPENALQLSPRIGFIWDVRGDRTLKVRGGSGLFAGRLPLVFFTNMPTNAAIVQTTYTAGYNYTTKTEDPRMQGLAGKLLGVPELVQYFNVPTTNQNHLAGNKISGVDRNFKMPQEWKTSIAVDYQMPFSFPLTVTAEFLFRKFINNTYIDNINIKDDDTSSWQRFNGPDNRLIYPSDMYYVKGKNAVMLKNTSKGYGYTANVTIVAEPVKNLNIMAAYTHTENKEISGLPGSDPISTWQGVISVDGPNLCATQRSQFVTPDKVIASVGYYIPFRYKGLLRGTHLNLFYQAYSASGNSFMYTNDMNGDGINNDLMYIPANDSEIQFKSESDRVAFWQFVSQDKYLSKHRGEYAEAYAARAPWVHRIDLHFAEDFEFKIGATKHKLQASVDILNLGNLINSGWGIPKNSQVSNYNKILKYEGRDDNNTPVFSMYKVNGEYPTKTYDYNTAYSNCWKMQVGLKYFFN